MPSLHEVVLSAELTGQINSFLKRAHEYSFSNKTQSVEEIAEEADETLFFKTQCKQHCLNPLSLLLNPTLMAFVPGDIPMRSQNVDFSSAKKSCIIRRLYSIALFYVLFFFLCDSSIC